MQISAQEFADAIAKARREGQDSVTSLAVDTGSISLDKKTPRIYTWVDVNTNRHHVSYMYWLNDRKINVAFHTSDSLLNSSAADVVVSELSDAIKHSVHTAVAAEISDSIHRACEQLLNRRAK